MGTDQMPKTSDVIPDLKDTVLAEIKPTQGNAIPKEQVLTTIPSKPSEMEGKVGITVQVLKGTRCKLVGVCKPERKDEVVATLRWYQVLNEDCWLLTVREGDVPSMLGITVPGEHLMKNASELITSADFKQLQHIVGIKFPQLKFKWHMMRT